MAYTVNNYYVFKSEILPKRMTNIFYSQFALFAYDPHVGKLWNTARWQEPAFEKSFRSQSDQSLIVVWNVPESSPMKYQLVDGQICTGLKQHFATKYLVDGLALGHKMNNSEFPAIILPCESDHSLNVMTGFYCVWNKMFTIYVALQMI